MSDIFVSYDRTDKERIRPIVNFLGIQGWSIWWDTIIPPGKTFDQVIEEAIGAAKCILVVWSVHSVKSHWVKTEAAEGLRRDVMIPVMIDDVVIPLEFRRIQSANLIDFQKLVSSYDTELLLLLDAIGKLTGKSASISSEETKAPSIFEGKSGLIPKESIPAEMRWPPYEDLLH